MRRLARSAPGLLGALVLAMAAGAPSAAAPLPPEAFGALAAESDVQLSPDGHWLAWQDHTAVRPRVIIFDVQARKEQRVLAVPEQTKLRSLDWNDSETLLITVSQAFANPHDAEHPYEITLTIAQDVGGGTGRLLLADPTRHGLVPPSALVSARTTKPKTAIMAQFLGCGRTVNRCLKEVDTRTGRATLVKAGNELTTAWVVDRDGRAVARADWDWRRHLYRLLALHGDDVQEIFQRDDGENPTLAGLLEDGSAVVLLAANGRSHQAAWALPLDGSPARLLVEDPASDITGVYHDGNTGALVGVYVGDVEGTTRWLEPSAQHRFEMVQHAFPDRHVYVYGWTEDGRKALALVQTPSIPPLFYVVDFATHHADIAAEQYPDLAGARLGELSEITYKARDGTPIPAYLTRPPDKATAPLPLVVVPHDGPHARDYPRFHWIVQFLASRGYAVLQPQFRGSTGFGQAFREAGYRQWGGLMQDDVTDGVRAMIDQGIADPHRICIVGAGYGGYVALAGVAFTPDLYACAASIDGLSDLPAMMRDTVPTLEATKSTMRAYWEAHVGALNDRNLSVKSPINAVKAVTAPVLLIYGTGVGAAPRTQSTEMARALQAAGKNVTLVALPGDDYWGARTETRVQVLKELEAFLREHL